MHMDRKVLCTYVNACTCRHSRCKPLHLLYSWSGYRPVCDITYIYQIFLESCILHLQGVSRAVEPYEPQILPEYLFFGKASYPQETRAHIFVIRVLLYSKKQMGYNFAFREHIFAEFS